MTSRENKGGRDSESTDDFDWEAVPGEDPGSADVQEWTMGTATDAQTFSMPPDDLSLYEQAQVFVGDHNETFGLFSSLMGSALGDAPDPGGIAETVERGISAYNELSEHAHVEENFAESVATAQSVDEVGGALIGSDVSSAGWAGEIAGRDGYQIELGTPAQDDGWAMGETGPEAADDGWTQGETSEDCSPSEVTDSTSEGTNGLGSFSAEDHSNEATDGSETDSGTQ